jgi:hypothetical protein
LRFDKAAAREAPDHSPLKAGLILLCRPRDLLAMQIAEARGDDVVTPSSNARFYLLRLSHSKADFRTFLMLVNKASPELGHYKSGHGSVTATNFVPKQLPNSVSGGVSGNSIG